MIVVVDASVLVAELLRPRSRELFTHDKLQTLVAEEQWGEAEYELERRLNIIVDQGRVDATGAQVLSKAAAELIADRTIEVVPNHLYAGREELARRRIPRDPDDWAPVALAITLKAGILTNDRDFLGCGCATWSVDTLRHELDRITEEDSPVAG